MAAFKWDLVQNCVVEIVTNTAGFLGSFHGRPLTDWEEVEESDIVDDKLSKMTFDLGFHFNLKREEGGAGFDDALSMASMKTGTSNATFAVGIMLPDLVIDLANDASHSEISHTGPSVGSAPANLHSGRFSAPSGDVATSAANAASEQ